LNKNDNNNDNDNGNHDDDNNNNNNDDHDHDKDDETLNPKPTLTHIPCDKNNGSILTNIAQGHTHAFAWKA